MAARLLVTGAGGFLGWIVSEQASRMGWDVHALRHCSCIPDICHPIEADLCNPDEMARALEEVAPDAVIHCAALANANTCENNPDLSRSINVLGTISLATACQGQDCVLVIVSTDLVFDGCSAPYAEYDRARPVQVYGRHKLEAETAACAFCERTVICRMPVMFGQASPSSGSFLSALLSAWREGRTVRLFTDEFRTPVDGVSAARGLLMATEWEPGIYHLGGRERISRYEFGVKMADVFRLPVAAIEPCSQKEVDLAAARPADVSLDSSKAYAKGYAPAALDEALGALAAEV